MTFLPFRLARAVLAGIGTAYETLIPGPSIHGYRLDAAEVLAEAEAEQEVSEPRYPLEDLVTGARWGEPSRCPNAGRMCNCTGECLRPEAPVAGQRGENPAGGTPPSPAGSPTPGEFAAVAVREVLATTFLCGRGHLRIEDARTDDWSADDWHDWREYAAAAVRRRIDDAAQPPQFETGLDMGVSVASEFFPQHQKPQ